MDMLATARALVSSSAALIGNWGARLIPKQVERFYGTLNAKDALPRSREERISRLWEAIRTLA